MKFEFSVRATELLKSPENKTTIMKRILLLVLIFSFSVFTQVLKEMEVKPTGNRGDITIFRDYPAKAGIIFYTQ